MILIPIAPLPQDQSPNVIDFCIEYLHNTGRWRIKMTAVNPRRTKFNMFLGKPECQFRANDYAKVLKTTGKKVTEVAENIGAEVVNDGFNNHYYYFQSVDHAKQFIEGLSRWLVPLRLQGYQIHISVDNFGFNGEV